MRVQTAFKRMLRLAGASVRDVEFGGGVIVTVGLRRRRKLCAGCGTARGLQIRDRRVKRWRHLDLGACRCVIECELRRLDCRRCGELALEAVPWARARAPYTRDFEDTVVRHEASLNHVGCRSPRPGRLGAPSPPMLT